MSNFLSDLIHRTAMLGRSQSDLRDSQAGELDMVMRFNREERAKIEAKRELREVQEELLEWQAKSESFRRLARAYADALGKSQEERNQERREITMSLGEERPEVARTKFFADTKAELGRN